MTDASQQNNTGPLGGPVIISKSEHFEAEVSTHPNAFFHLLYGTVKKMKKQPIYSRCAKQHTATG